MEPTPTILKYIIWYFSKILWPRQPLITASCYLHHLHFACHYSSMQYTLRTSIINGQWLSKLPMPVCLLIYTLGNESAPIQCVVALISRKTQQNMHAVPEIFNYTASLC